MDFVFVKIGTVSECNMEISYTIEGKTVGGGVLRFIVRWRMKSINGMSIIYRAGSQL